MNQFRLFIDIPLGTDEDNAIAVAKSIVEWHFQDVDAKEKIQRLAGGRMNLSEINYRLGHDEDRQKSNYIDKTENGHVTTRKCRIAMENA
tara:strand:+ start:463 stop:732 length:270 start_codon:yes stop_codon:yes gene_type:complete